METRWSALMPDARNVTPLYLQLARNLATAISIGGFEVITKLVLYFFHERYWARIRWGIIPGSA